MYQLQMVLNAAARFVVGARKFQHPSPPRRAPLVVSVTVDTI